MKPVLAAALAASLLLAACDRPPQPRTEPSAGSGPSLPMQPRPQTGASTLEQKKEGNPVQGQVDPKQSAQHKDFQQPGDKSGPKQ